MAVSAGGLHIKDELLAARQRRVSIRMALHRAVLETERAAGLASHRHQHHLVRDEIHQEADRLRRALAVQRGRLNHQLRWPFAPRAGRQQTAQKPRGHNKLHPNQNGNQNGNS